MRLMAIFILLFGLSAWAGFQMELTGQILRVEKGYAIMKAKDGESKIEMKSLSKAQREQVNESMISKKAITLRVTPAALGKK